MNLNQAFPSKFLSKEDVKDSPKICVIDTVTVEEIEGDNGKENKPTLFFSDNTKPMILNRINWMTIAEFYGEDSDGWKGQSIEVYHDPSIMFGAKRTGGVRVRKPAAAVDPRAGLRAALKDTRAALRAASIEPAPMTQAQAADMTADELIAALRAAQEQLPV